MSCDADSTSWNEDAKFWLSLHVFMNLAVPLIAFDKFIWPYRAIALKIIK